MAATVPACVSPDQRAEMVASPSPTSPASVWTFTITYGDVTCSPCAVFAVIPFLSGTHTGIGSIFVTFITRLDRRVGQAALRRADPPQARNLRIFLRPRGGS